MGGIARRAAEIEADRDAGIPVIVIEGGNFSPEYSEQGIIKFDTMLEAFEETGYDAVSLGRREILIHTDSHNAWEKLKGSGIPLVTLNLKYRNEQVAETPRIIRRSGNRVALFGLILEDFEPEEQTGEWTVVDPETVIDDALGYAATEADITIAALDGTREQVEEFVRAHPGMDIVIDARNPETAFAPDEINDSYLLSAGSTGKYLGKIEADFVHGQWLFDARLVGLTMDIPEHPVLAETYRDYQRRVKDMAEDRVEAVGEEIEGDHEAKRIAKTCRSCHDAVYTAWARTPHAHAMDSLVRANEHQNPECIGCHVVGYMKGGFVSLDRTPEYAGVQCVSCHGDMEGHIEYHSGVVETESAQPPEVTEGVCLRCHTPENDDDFDFDRDSKRVHPH